MIDLGDELAGYGEESHASPTHPEGMPSFGRLADLQAGGFNTKPDVVHRGQGWGFNTGLSKLSVKVVPTTTPGGGGGGGGLSVPWVARVAGGLAGTSFPLWGAQDDFGSTSEDDPE